jgi:hypothetical protein
LFFLAGNSIQSPNLSPWYSILMRTIQNAWLTALHPWAGAPHFVHRYCGDSNGRKLQRAQQGSRKFLITNRK